MLFAACAAILALAFSSCAGKLEPLTASDFTCNPSPLVEVGGQVDATITVSYPVKYFKKKGVLTLTPVLVYDGGETKSDPITFQGEKVNGNDQEVSYKYGGTATFKAHFDYIPAMRNSKLYIEFKAETGSKTYTLPRIAIADGVIATESMSTAASANPGYGYDNFVKDTFDKYVASLIYQVNSSNLRSSETKKSEMKDVETAIAATKNEERREFEGIEMVSTASPEGALQLNERLANSREKSSAQYLNKFLKKAKMEGQITPEQIAEDWEGFQRLVEQSDIQDKQLILGVLRSYSDPERREQEIRNLSAAFSELKEDILPQLRYSKITATVKNIGHTDEEILSLLYSDNEQLTLEELLYAATLVDTDAKKADIFKLAMKKNPSDYRAKNNLAALSYRQGNVEEAEKMWKEVLSANPTAAEPNLNLALVAMQNGDVKAAEAFMGKAGQSKEYGEAMGTLMTQQGRYTDAINYFGDVKTNNAAVAQICAGKYADAEKTLNAIEKKDATTYYLLAVAAARQGVSSNVESNLKKAKALDSSIKSLAQGDLEFAKFQNVVESL